MIRLSIIIPEYNFDCTTLVKDLHAQCSDAVGKDNFEILVIDDGSNEETRQSLSDINQWTGCRLIEKGKNTGRADCRNFGIRQAQGELVIIMDCDAEVAAPNYIKNYLSAFEKDDEVICGGLNTSIHYLNKTNKLRYRYETNASRLYKDHIKECNPYECFSVFNVCIRNDVFRKVTFNERFSRYGHEDTLFGIELKKQGVKVRLINNQLIHTGIDDNASFLGKTEEALRNLWKFRDLFEGEIKILRTARKLEKYHATPLLRLWHRLFKRIEQKNLLGNNPSLFVFKLYKLGYLLNLRHSEYSL